jgi:hypothetical protein
MQLLDWQQQMATADDTALCLLLLPCNQNVLQEQFTMHVPHMRLCC